MSLVSRFTSRPRRIDKPGRYHPHAREMSTPEFVDLAYLVLLGRKPDRNELDRHQDAIEGGWKSRNHLVYELIQGAEFKAENPDLKFLDQCDFVSLSYQVMLGRKGSAEEVERNAKLLSEGKITRNHLFFTLSHSDEFQKNTWTGADFWMILHQTRFLLAAQLPKARIIVDLGGRCEGRPEGALLTFGYPYSFDRLTIVDLPRDQSPRPGDARHEPIQTPRGPVNYVDSSMTDLSAIGDGTVDLVHAGRSIDNAAFVDVGVVMREVHRILKPGGHFCLDTPNRNLTRLSSPGVVSEKPKPEYTHQEMSGFFVDNGFEVREAKGLILMDRSVNEGRFIAEESARRDRMYDDIENCFLLYYKARKV